MTTSRWKEQLQKASFRGIEFHVTDVQTVVGRRSVLHEYPQRDAPYVEDLGRKAREYSFNAYVIGENYVEQLQRLMRAMEQDGSIGVLVHPTLGIMNVSPKECRVTFKGTEGGIEHLSLTFIESGINQFPAAETDTQNNTLTVAEESIENLEESFSEHYAILGFSDSLATRATNTLIGSDPGDGGDVIFRDNSLYGVMTSVVSRGAYFAGSRTNYSVFRNDLNNFRDDVSTFIDNPPQVARRITNLVSGLSSIYPDQSDKILLAQKQLYNTFGLLINAIPLTTPASPVGTPNREQMVLNQAQLLDIVHIAALIQIAVSVAFTEFTSRTDALKLMFDLQRLMEPKLTYLANNQYDQAYQALNNARIAMVLDIKSRSATLKNVKYIQTNYAVPAIVLAYQQYQDSTQEQDVIDRNRAIRNPLFVPANSNIEILV